MQKIVHLKQKIIFNWELVYYTREEIKAMYPECVIQEIMPERNREGRITGQLIIEIETNKVDDENISKGLDHIVVH